MVGDPCDGLESPATPHRPAHLPQLVAQSQPDVVLLDAHLPGVTGPDACAQLIGRFPDVRIVIVSTYSDDDLVRECIEAGAHGYVIKDIERFELKESRPRRAPRAPCHRRSRASPRDRARVPTR